MTMGAAVGQAVLSVVTFIVAMKTLGIRGRRGFQEHTGQSLCRSRDDPMSCNHSLSVGMAK